MTTLSIDIETFSSADLLKCGVYKYAEAPDFEILMLAYSFDEQHPRLLVMDEIESEGFIRAIKDPSILKTAYNANFERTCIAKAFNIELDPAQWLCTMAKAALVGLPAGLDAVAKALKLDAGKDASGKQLIRYFSMPCKPTKTNGGRTRNLPHHDIEKWKAFEAYCIQDVKVEMAIRKKLEFFDFPETEKRLWNLDQKINDRGILMDPTLVKQAIRIDRTHAERLSVEAVELTGLENPNSVSQLKEWIGKETGEEVEKLTKETVPQLLEKTSCETVTRLLQIRQQMAKSSVKKYEAMARILCADDRVRGIHQYYGAGRTGRWAGRLVQPQNMPRNELKDLDLARALVREGDADMTELLFGNVPDTLSQLVRTAFVAKDKHRFIITDFSAIEARVIAWLAGENWRLEVFKSHGKIYEASASHMFKVPIDKIDKASPLRQRGKVAELALGYGGGPKAIQSMEISNKVPMKERIPEEEMPKLVNMWRNANKAIVKYWEVIEEAAIETVETGVSNTLKHGISFHVERNILFITLPSGRRLSYLRPQVRPGRYGGHALTYEGMSQTTKQWMRQDTYGGKLVENIVQAVARDCLADAMLRIDEAGYDIVMHVHDEIVIEAPNGQGSIEEINKIMSTPIPWAKGLPLQADSHETEYYKKD